MLFQRYVSPDIVEQVTSGGALHLGGEKRKISALFADVRNFTPLAESLSPGDVVQFLNSFFSKVVTVIFNHQGTLDKFIGDAIMVVFGAPLEQQDQEQRAVDTAIDMLRVAKQHSEEIQKQGKPGFEIGIGIASGDAVVGNIGSLRRMEYTAIGDTVNLAARLEELAPGGEVWITESIHEHCKIPEDSVCGPGKEITVKGKTQSQLVYAIKLCPDKQL
jgi:adenylate cyclase